MRVQESEHNTGATRRHERRDLAVALSGGGVRASLFGLGALLFLVDSGVNRQVTTISSVSGGSITSAFVAQETDFATTTSDDFDPIAADLISRLEARPLFGRRTVRVVGAVYLLLFAVAFGVAFAEWPVGAPLPVRIALPFAAGALFSLRGWVVEGRLRRHYFSRSKAPITLSEIGQDTTTVHVFCATDLVNAAAAFFVAWRGGFVMLRGRWQRKDSLNLATAVRASTALPIAFPPRLFRGRPLVDGGVWNNLGTQWFDDGVGASFVAHDEQEEVRPVDALPGSGAGDVPTFSGLVLVIDASGKLMPMKAPAARLFTVPLINELLAIARAGSTLYENTLAPRQRASAIALESKLYDPGRSSIEESIYRSIAALGDPGAERTVIPMLRRAAPTLKYEFLRVRYLEIAGMAEAFVAALNADGTVREQTHTNGSVKTKLDRVGNEAALQLLIEGYLQSAIRCAPLLALSAGDLGDKTMSWPGRERFERLLPAER